MFIQQYLSRYRDPANAAIALKKLNGKKVGGRQVAVDWALSKSVYEQVRNTRFFKIQIHFKILVVNVVKTVDTHTVQFMSFDSFQEAQDSPLLMCWGQPCA